MADAKVLTENDDDIDIVEVAELPTGPEKKAAQEPEDDDEDDSGQQEDSRLADAEDEDEDDARGDAESTTAKKRVKRRQIQKQARDRTLAEVQFLRQQNEDLVRRISAVEGSTLNTSEAQVDQRLSEVRRDIETADIILARAIEAGNGTDAATALRLRDEAKAAELDLIRTKGSFGEARKPKTPTVDPVVANFSNQWKAANPWYGAAGSEEDSAIVNIIDNRLAAEGYDPKSMDYWSELTRRTTARLHPNGAAKGADTAPKKKAPPQGVSREHAPQSTRTEVHVTPERKAAMIEAGKWDDPKERNKLLKAYAAYDREHRSAG